MHTSRHTRKNSGFSTQDEPLGLLGLEALTEAPNFHYATRSIYLEAIGGFKAVTDILFEYVHGWAYTKDNPEVVMSTHPLH